MLSRPLPSSTDRNNPWKLCHSGFGTYLLISSAAPFKRRSGSSRAGTILPPSHRVLSLKPDLRLEWRGQDGQDETQKPDHSASLGDSVTSSTRIGFSVHTRASWPRLLSLRLR